MFERFDAEAHFAGVFGAGEEFERHLAAAFRGEAVAGAHQIACHKGEQVAGFGEGVVPFGPVAVVGQRAVAGAVAVGKQHGEAGAVGADAGGVDAHHVGAVGVVGDFAEAFRFALGVEVAAARVEPHQGFVVVRIKAGGYAQLEGLGGDVRDG